MAASRFTVLVPCLASLALTAVALTAGCAGRVTPPSAPLPARQTPAVGASSVAGKVGAGAPLLAQDGPVAEIDRANRADVTEAFARFRKAEVRVGRERLQALFRSLGSRVAPLLDRAEGHLVLPLLRSLRDVLAAVDLGRVPAAKRHEVYDVMTVALADLMSLQAAVEACSLGGDGGG